MTTTNVEWAPGQPSEEESAQIRDKAAEMASQGKTDNNPTTTQVGDDIIYQRTWTTVTDAEEWVTFVEQFNPVSATITN